MLARGVRGGKNSKLIRAFRLVSVAFEGIGCLSEGEIGDCGPTSRRRRFVQGYLCGIDRSRVKTDWDICMLLGAPDFPFGAVSQMSLTKSKFCAREIFAALCKGPSHTYWGWNMAQMTIVYWRDIPAQVIVKKGRTAAKRQLPERFEQAIDRCAMKVCARDTDTYLAEWRSGTPVEVDADKEELADAEAARLDAEFDTAKIKTLIANGGWAAEKA
jgi:hypothetical protein